MLIVNSHPVPYHIGIYRLLHASPHLETEVVFLWDVFKYPPEQHGWKMEFDRSELLNGYSYRFIKNVSWRQNNDFLGLINPGLFSFILRDSCKVVMIFGYNSISTWIALIAAKISGKKVIFKGEVDDLSKRGRIKTIIRRLYLKLFFTGVIALVIPIKTMRTFSQFGRTAIETLFTPCAVDNTHFRQLAKKVDTSQQGSYWESQMTTWFFFSAADSTTANLH